MTLFSFKVTNFQESEDFCTLSFSKFSVSPDTAWHAFGTFNVVQSYSYQTGVTVIQRYKFDLGEEGGGGGRGERGGGEKSKQTETSFPQNVYLC